MLRNAFRMTAAAALLFASSAAYADGELHLYNWGDYTNPKLIEKFEHQYNVTVTLDDYDSNDTLLAKIRAGNTGYDVVFPSDYAVKILLDRGADVNAVDYNGDTAMHGAAYGSFPAIVKLLADHGAKPEIWNKPNSQGSTPLYVAEGYRYGRPIVSRPTIDAIQHLMAAAGLSTEGVRPPKRDIYEKVPEPTQRVPKQ